MLSGFILFHPVSDCIKHFPGLALHARRVYRLPHRVGEVVFDYPEIDFSRDLAAGIGDFDGAAHGLRLPYEGKLLDRVLGEPVRVFAEPGGVDVAVLPLLAAAKVFGVKIRPESRRLPLQQPRHLPRVRPVFLAQLLYQIILERPLVERYVVNVDARQFRPDGVVDVEFVRHVPRFADPYAVLEVLDVGR